MCGIFGYLNVNKHVKRSHLLQILLDGIKRMEYRGYDSAGITLDVVKDGERQPSLYKRSGKVGDLQQMIFSLPENMDCEYSFQNHFGMAHTRWATHGAPSEANSHPQSSGPENEFLVVHNGIITNYKQLYVFLVNKGYKFSSETDTECIVLLMKYFYDNPPEGQKYTLKKLIKVVLPILEGAFALIVKSVHFPGECVCAKLGSPMIVGVKGAKCSNSPVTSSTIYRPTSDLESELENSCNCCSKEIFIASDVCAIVEHTRKVLYMRDNEMIYINKNGVIDLCMFNVSKSKKGTCSRNLENVDLELEQIMMGNYETFMEKEIFEQPDSMLNTLRGRINISNHEIVLGGLKKFANQISRSKRLIFIACGTSYNSALATRQLFSEMTDLPIMVEIASDFNDKKMMLHRDDACIFISQSGETADSIIALNYCKNHNVLLIGITNVVGSTISRETDCGIHVNAGPEIGVASTKAYTSQVAALNLFACWMARDSISRRERIMDIIDSMFRMPDILKKTLECKDVIKKVASELYTANSMLILGRGFQHATCLEGALKIKEITYIHTEGVLSGELKHGTLALVDENLPIIIVISKDSVYPKSMSALEQILSRKARPIIICDEECDITDSRIRQVIRIPRVSDCCQAIPFVIPLQLLSLYIGQYKGNNIDFPRNLAKSVTVE